VTWTKAQFADNLRKGDTSTHTVGREEGKDSKVEKEAKAMQEQRVKDIPAVGVLCSLAE